MSHAMGVRGGGGLFSNDDSQPLFGGMLFSTIPNDLEASSVDANGEPDDMDGSRSAVSGARKNPISAI
jgi:SAGA-associated factor 73